MIKINEKLAILGVRHGTSEARHLVSSLVARLENLPFNVKLGLELNEQDAYFI